MGQNSRAVALLLIMVAVGLGYVCYTGTGINALGMTGMQARVERVQAVQDTLDDLHNKIDIAKRDLARESVEDVKRRVDAYRASLAVLRTLVPEQREVANLLDDLSLKARLRGLTLSAFTPQTPLPGPAPFDTYSYQFSAVGHYHNVGRFLTDIASLRRIMVPGDVSIAAANMQQARAFGDTTGMLEARFIIRTYVKAKAAEDSAHAQ